MITFTKDKVVVDVGEKLREEFAEYKTTDFHLFGGAPHRHDIEFRSTNRQVCDRVLRLLTAFQEKRRFSFFAYSGARDEDAAKTSIVLSRRMRESNSVETLTKLVSAMIKAADGVIQDLPEPKAINTTWKPGIGTLIRQNFLITQFIDDYRNVVGSVGIMSNHASNPNLCVYKISELRMLEVSKADVMPVDTNDMVIEEGELMYGSGIQLDKKLYNKYNILSRGE